MQFLQYLTHFKWILNIGNQYGQAADDHLYDTLNIGPKHKYSSRKEGKIKPVEIIRRCEQKLNQNGCELTLCFQEDQILEKSLANLMLVFICHHTYGTQSQMVKSFPKSL